MVGTISKTEKLSNVLNFFLKHIYIIFMYSSELPIIYIFLNTLDKNNIKYNITNTSVTV